jgi:hypothetical protein
MSTEQILEQISSNQNRLAALEAQTVESVEAQRLAELALRDASTGNYAQVAANTAEIIAARHEIARDALNGDLRYSHCAIGSADGDINDMGAETGMVLVHRADSDSDVAVYANGSRNVLVADANGPVAIRLVGGAA